MLYRKGIAALLYAVVDRVIFHYSFRDKVIVIGTVMLVLLYVIPWVYLEAISPQVSPFTEDDAVAFATNGEGMEIDKFPKEIGVWYGNENGNQVKSETSVEAIGHEIYIVTFTESWESKETNGSWYISYEVDRDSMTMVGSGEEEPLL